MTRTIPPPVTPVRTTDQILRDRARQRDLLRRGPVETQSFQTLTLNILAPRNPDPVPEEQRPFDRVNEVVLEMVGDQLVVQDTRNGFVRNIPNPAITAQMDQLPMLKSMPVVNRRYELPPFCIKYDSFEEITRRLNQTIILHNGEPLYVNQIVDDPKRNFILVVTDAARKRHKLPFADITDLRSPEPGYVNIAGRVFYMLRNPVREWQQGLTRANTTLKEVGATSGVLMDDALALVSGLNNRTVIQWKKANNLLETKITDAIRLSSVLALYRGINYQLEYRGRKLGGVVKGAVSPSDKEDAEQPWITEDLKEVGLTWK